MSVTVRSRVGPELRKKLVLLYRRPFPQPAANNEPWDTAFDVFGGLAVLTNTALVVFSSTAFDGWGDDRRILLFLGAEHLVLLVRDLVGFAWPAVPESVRLLRLQQREIVHRHFDLGGEEPEPELNAFDFAVGTAPPVFNRDNEEDEEVPS